MTKQNIGQVDFYSYGTSQKKFYPNPSRQEERFEANDALDYLPITYPKEKQRIKLDTSVTVLQVLEDTKQIYREKRMYKEFIECIQKSLRLKLDLLIAEDAKNITNIDLPLIEKIIKEIVKEINEEAMEQLEASDIHSSLYLLSMSLEIIQSLTKFNFIIESSKSFASLTILCLNNMAFVYRRLGHLNSSLNCLHKASDISESVGLIENVAVTHLNICAVLSKLKQHNLAIEHAQQAVYLAQEDLVANNEEINANIGGITNDECIIPDKRSSIHQKITTLAVSYYNLAVELEHEGFSDLSLDWYERAIKVMECDPSHNISLLKSFRKSYKIANKRLIPGTTRREYADISHQGEHNNPTEKSLPQIRQKKEDKKSYEDNKETAKKRNKCRTGEPYLNVRPVSADHTVVKSSSYQSKERNVHNDHTRVTRKNSSVGNPHDGDCRKKNGSKLRPQSAYPRLLKTSQIFDTSEENTHICHDNKNQNVDSSTLKENDLQLNSLNNLENFSKELNSSECREELDHQGETECQSDKSPQDIVRVQEHSSNIEFKPLSSKVAQKESKKSTSDPRLTDIFYIASTRIQAIVRGYIVRSKIKKNVQSTTGVADKGSTCSLKNVPTEKDSTKNENFDQEIIISPVKVDSIKDGGADEKKVFFNESEAAKSLIIEEKTLEIEGKTFTAIFYKTLNDNSDEEDSLYVILSTRKEGTILKAVLPSFSSNQSTVEDEIQKACKFIEGFILQNFCKKEKNILQNEDYKSRNTTRGFQNEKRPSQLANQNLEKLHGEAVNLAAIEIQRMYKGYHTRTKEHLLKIPKRK